MKNMCWWMPRLKYIKNYNKYIKILFQLRVSSALMGQESFGFRTMRTS